MAGLNRTEQDDTTMEKLPSTTEDEPKIKKLVALSTDGDESAFGELVGIYERFVYHTALRTLRSCGGNSDDGEDVAQDAFLKAWRSLSAFRGECAFSTWLYRITVNCAKDHCRIEGRHPTVSLTMSENEEPDMQLEIPVSEGDTIPEAALERKETTRLVREAIGALPEEMRTVLLLRDMEDLPYADIADLLHLEVGTVKSRLNRARMALKQLLAGKI